jgi:hypothetical protein
LRLVAEVNPFGRPVEQRGVGATPVPMPLPPAILLNHRAGGRRLVPARITALRLRGLLRRAIETGGVVHLYSHPHNFITGRGQLELLADVLGLVRAHVAAGELRVLTQSAYAAELPRMD